MSVLLVTGAGGYLGREVVAAALRAGYRVRAQTRRPDAALTQAGAQVVEADLRADDLGPLLAGIDVLVHCAAAKSGDFHTQYASTVVATRRLLRAAPHVRRVVLCSSFAVYDYLHLAAGALVDESSATLIDGGGDDRDAYAQTKALQEQVSAEVCQELGLELAVIRPGVVYDTRPPTRGGSALSTWWTYRLGERFGRLWLGMGAGAQVPLVHVADCAEALVVAAGSPRAAGCTFNALAPSPPTQRQLRQELARAARPRPVVVPVPWAVARAGAAVLAAGVQRASGTWRLPGFLVPSGVAVRAKPLRYAPSALAELGWTPRHEWRADLAEVTERRTDESSQPA